MRRRLGLTDFEDVHLYLLDRDGRVAWSGSGGLDDEQVAGLVRALEDLLGAGA